MAWAPKTRSARGRQGHRQPDGDHDLDQRRPVPDESEQHGVQDHAEQGRHHQQRQEAGIGCGPPVLGVQPVVEAGHHERHGPEGEVEDPGGDEGDDQPGRRDGVDGAKGQPGQYVLQHPPYLSGPGREPHRRHRSPVAITTRKWSHRANSVCHNFPLAPSENGSDSVLLRTTVARHPHLCMTFWSDDCPVPPGLPIRSLRLKSGIAPGAHHRGPPALLAGNGLARRAEEGRGRPIQTLISFFREEHSRMGPGAGRPALPADVSRAPPTPAAPGARTGGGWTRPGRPASPRTSDGRRRRGTVRPAAPRPSGRG